MSPVWGPVPSEGREPAGSSAEEGLNFNKEDLRLDIRKTMPV